MLLRLSNFGLVDARDVLRRLERVRVRPRRIL